MPPDMRGVAYRRGILRGSSLTRLRRWILTPFYAAYRRRRSRAGRPISPAISCRSCSTRARAAFDPRGRSSELGGRHRLSGYRHQPEARSRHARALQVAPQVALAELFGVVLALCAKAGLLESGVVAIDSTKISASASRLRDDSTYEQIAQEILEEAKRTDEAEDELYGEGRGDELPPGIATRAGRRGWLREAQRELDEQRSREARPIRGRGRSGSRKPSGGWRSSFGSSSARTRPSSVSASWVAIRWVGGSAPDQSHTHRQILPRKG